MQKYLDWLNEVNGLVFNDSQGRYIATDLVIPEFLQDLYDYGYTTWDAADQVLGRCGIIPAEMFHTETS